MSDRTNRIKSQVTTQVSKATTQVKDITDATAARAQGAGTVTAPIGTPDNPSNQVFTVANAITFCRLILTLSFFISFAPTEIGGLHLPAMLLLPLRIFLTDR